MKFKYCIVNLFDNEARGTNDQDIAAEYSRSEEHIVINLTTGQLLIEGDPTEMKQLEVGSDGDSETEDIDKE